MGSKSQRKGRGGELELARILQGYGYQVEAAQALNYGTISDLTGLPNVHIECKRAEKLRLSEWMRQSEYDSARFGDGLPAVFFRRNREDWRVVMNLSDWMEIYRSYQPPKGSNHT